MRRFVMQVGIFFVALGWAGPAGAQSAGGYYKNEKWGYRFRPPRGFTEAALSADEEWVASKHIAKRRLYAKRSEFLEGDYPQVWVIGFPHVRQKERGARVERKADGVTEVTFKNPYKDYKDFVRRERWFVGGGYYFSKEEEREYKGMKVTVYEIKVEKMVAAPYRIVAWVYHFDDIDFALQCKVLEDYYEKYGRAFDTCFKSFRRIPRTSAMPGSASTGRRITIEEDESKLTPAERARRRQERFESKLRREIANLPKSWNVRRSKHFVALYNCDDSFVRTVLNHAEVLRRYLDDTLGAVGGDYVPPGIIRIFATSAEQEAYAKTSSAFWFLGSGAEVQVCEESARAGLTSWEMESLSADVGRQWLSARNRLLYDNLPSWFWVGFDQYLRFVRVKGRSAKVKPDAWDRSALRDLIRQGKAAPIRTLFEQDLSEAQKGAIEISSYQCGSVITYLMTKGNRGKFKNAVRNYLANLVAAIEEAEAAYKAKKEQLEEEAAAETEERLESGEEAEESEDEENAGEDEESEDYWARLEEAMKERRRSIRQKAFEATFGHLTDKDWKRLDRAWQKYAGG